MDAPIRTARLVLSPVEAEDADELAAVFADERLYAFTGGRPGTVEELRGTLGRLARERAGDPWAQRNWACAGSPTGRRSGCSRRPSAAGGGRPRSPGWWGCPGRARASPRKRRRGSWAGWRLGAWLR